jgi:hypothetical protein
LLSKSAYSSRNFQRIWKFSLPRIWKFCAGFVFRSKEDESRRAFNVAQLIKIRIERMNAVCAFRPLPLMSRAGSTVAEPRRLLQRSSKREVYL